ncbi:MAG: histidine-type phosphatase [Oligoflexia bacterium]|nr:histidine-type phosphatase [Oligoflexia bacterium]
MLLPAPLLPACWICKTVLLESSLNLPLFKERKFKHFFYFAHDSSIMAVMTTLGDPLNKTPDYLSRLNFSLFALEDGRKIVRVKFNQKFVKEYYRN